MLSLNGHLDNDLVSNTCPYKENNIRSLHGSIIRDNGNIEWIFPSQKVPSLLDKEVHFVDERTLKKLN